MPNHDDVLDEITRQIRSEADPERAMAAAVATLERRMPDYSWVGLYLLDGNELVLGPFEGKPSPHTRIPLGRGICGAAASDKAILAVGAGAQATRLEGEVTRGIPAPGATLSAKGAAPEPVVFRKRVDASTPLIAKALCNNQVIEQLDLTIGDERYRLQNARCTCQTSDAIEEITIVHEKVERVK